MPLDWREGALAQGLACFRSRQFFLAHEHWEDAWRDSAEPEKTFLQALIQIAAAFYHLSRGNALGAERLLRAAAGRLQRYPAEFAGVDIVALRSNVRLWIDALAAGNTAPKLPYPEIRRE
ncbi:MAG TPA: DUF309 domain-containing protein [Terracidiphilus sp.]|nr:DUF309 domain-containing protein [Terracidiphilus sp.]